MKLIFDYLKFTYQDYLRQREVKHKYYRDKKYTSIDRSLLKGYILKNPYSISKRYAKRHRKKDLHTYGETPLKTLEKIANEVKLKPTDTVLELGCGRGRGAFFLSHFFGCTVIGIEQIPFFVKIAEQVAKKFNVEKLNFYCKDMFEMKFLEVDVIYLYGTCLKNHEILRLVSNLKSSISKAKIITISYPLSDYDSEGVFQLEKTFPVTFPWGETDAYLQKIK